MTAGSLHHRPRDPVTPAAPRARQADPAAKTFKSLQEKRLRPPLQEPEKVLEGPEQFGVLPSRVAIPLDRYSQCGERPCPKRACLEAPSIFQPSVVVQRQAHLVRHLLLRRAHAEAQRLQFGHATRPQFVAGNLNKFHFSGGASPRWASGSKMTRNAVSERWRYFCRQQFRCPRADFDLLIDHG
jgi:hypothetical protein